MHTGLKKRQKITEIFFDEASPIITVATYNTDLKNRLTVYAKRWPNCCKLVDDDGWGRLTFEVKKGWFCFRLTLRLTARNAEKPQVSRQRRTVSPCSKIDKERMSAMEK